jgi:hypothetical protein
MDLHLKFCPSVIIYFQIPCGHDELAIWNIWGDKEFVNACDEYLLSLVKGRKSCFLAVQKGTLKYQIIEGNICLE